jgi:hypothetical protein
LEPFIYDGDIDDSPKDIKESALETLRPMYKMLGKFLDIQSPKIPIYNVIEDDEELPEKVFRLRVKLILSLN